ncbi:hypothetical protein ES703_119422 [subsurface metagenome]
MPGPRVDPPHAGEHRYIICALNIGRPPVVRTPVAAPNPVPVSRQIAHPAIGAVAANIFFGLPGVLGPGANIPLSGRLGGFRAAADIGLGFIEFHDGKEPPSAAAIS